MNNFKNILVDAVTDQPKTAVSRAIEWALGNNAQLTLMDVVKPLPKAIGMLTDVATPDKLQKRIADVLTANDEPLPLI